MSLVKSNHSLRSLQLVWFSNASLVVDMNLKRCMIDIIVNITGTKRLNFEAEYFVSTTYSSGNCTPGRAYGSKLTLQNDLTSRIS